MSILLTVNLVHATERLIVKYKVNPQETLQLSSGQITKIDIAREQMQPLTIDRINHLSTIVGHKVKDLHAIGTGAHVLTINDNLSAQSLKQVINIISLEPDIEYVEEDQRVYPSDIPIVNPLQWNMESSSRENIWLGANFIGAWNVLNGLDVTPGNGVVVAVVDTGYTPHPDILANLEPLSAGSSNYGYQFISDCRTSGSCPSDTPDNNAHLSPEPNGLDLGDYITQSQIQQSNGYFTGCNAQPASSWHGTHVSGITVATGYNGDTGVLGGAYGAKVVPVRVLGKCGGYDSDIQNGMLWAAGKHPTIPNLHPAQILNLSLGSVSNCSSGFQDTINAIVPDSAIVVSAGNEHHSVMEADPASCLNVISVAAVGPLNQISYYSNYGPTISTAPGGSKYQGGESAKVYSTVWGSVQAYDPESGGSYVYYEGTSMAAPHVSAALADIISYLSHQGLSWNSNTLGQIIQNSSSSDYGNCVKYNSVIGCAISGTLNLESSINYTQNYYNQILIPKPNLLIVGESSLGAEITFSNKQSSPVTVTNISVENQSGISVGQECIGVIPPGASCNTLVSTNSYVGPSKIVLLNSESIPIATVNVTLNQYVAPKTITSGGGCSLVTNSDDFGLLIIMLILCIVYTYNRCRLKGKE